VQFSRCGIFVSIVLGGEQLRNVASEGFGIGGAGPDDAYVDGGEQIQFVFPEGGVRGVSYDVSSASDLDGDELAGECVVRASDDEQLPGEELVAGEGPIDVSAVFRAAPIRALLLTSAPDGVRIGRISYQAPPFPITLWLGSVTAAHDGAEIDHCGIAFRGAPGLTHLGNGGIGVAGGTSDGIDAGEELEVDFGEPVRGVRYLPRALVPGDPGTTGVHSVEAFDAQGASLGVRAASASPSGADWVDLTSPSFFGDVPISRFVLSAEDDPILLWQIELVPEPCGAGAGAAALLALVTLRARRRRARS